jgi:hypothetical protein
MGWSPRGDQLGAAVDTECDLAAPCGGMLDLAAFLRANVLVHYFATLRAMHDGRVRTSVVHVLALPGLR